MLKLALNIIYRWYWLITLVTVLTAVTCYLILRQQPTMYRSSALLLVGPSTSSPNPELNDLRTSGQLLETYAALAITRPTLENIITELNLDMSPSLLLENIQITTTPETQIMSVRVFDEDADKAIAIAGAITARIVSLSPTSPGNSSEADPYNTLVLDQITRLEERIANSEQLIAQLQENLATATTREERTAVLNNILDERSRLSTTEQFLISLYDTLRRPATNRIEVVEPAVEASRIDSQTGVKTVIAAIAGLLLGLVISVGFEYFNDTVTSADDVPLPPGGMMLGTLYKSARKHPILIVDRAGETRSDFREIDRYRKFAAKLPSLLSANGDPKWAQFGKTLLVTGASENDELAEIAVNLGIGLTQMGLRVVLVDANYVAARVSRLFRLWDESGLSEGVAGESAPMPIPIDGITGLSVVPTGAKPPSSFALLASESVDKTLESLRGQADIVMIAAPELSSSDTAILGSKVDAAIVVTVNGRSNRSAIETGMQALPATIGLIFVDHATGLRRFLERKASA